MVSGEERAERWQSLESTRGQGVIEAVPDSVPALSLQLIVAHDILNELARELRDLIEP
jgi:hypothetical protein